jgi:hypothetical protein
MFDFCKDAKKETAKNLLWKIQHFFDKLNDNAARMWIPEKWLSIDKQMLGFHVWSRIKLHFSYKNKGDGFQCSAICDNSYTFSFYFRHGDPPPLPKESKDKLPDLSPRAMCVSWVALCPPNVWTRIFMENLFNSWKLFMVLHMAQCFAHGTVQTTGHGLPPSVRELKEKNMRVSSELRKGVTAINNTKN